MQFSMIFNFWSFMFFILSAAVSFGVYRKSVSEKKVVHMAALTSQIVGAVSLCAAVYLLSDLSNLTVLGKGFSFILLANFYTAIFNISCRVYKAIKE